MIRNGTAMDANAAFNCCTSTIVIHVIGKDNTWKIERKNLNFRTHIKRLNRKTICCSKNEKIHDNVIGKYNPARQPDKTSKKIKATQHNGAKNIKK
jgi:IS1 transposase